LKAYAQYRKEQAQAIATLDRFIASPRQSGTDYALYLKGLVNP
jgi:outer membrane protein assembly factor BamD (BamD/ComL family)